MKTPAQHNAQIAQKMVDFVPWNDGDATSVKVDGTYIRAQAKNAEKVAAKIRTAHRTYPAGAYKRAGTGRNYPAFCAGMTTAEYVLMHQSINPSAHILPIDFDRIGTRAAALYDNGALDFEPIEEVNEDYFDAQAAQDVAQVVASAQAMAAIEQASESSALQELASDTSTDTSAEQAACQADDVQELAIVGGLAQQASQQEPGASGGNMGHASTTNTSSVRLVASGTRGQSINSKSGAWSALFFVSDSGAPSMEFKQAGRVPCIVEFESGRDRMRALQQSAKWADEAAARQADTASVIDQSSESAALQSVADVSEATTSAADEVPGLATVDAEACEDVTHREMSNAGGSTGATGHSISTTYINGDKAEYTGKSNIIHGKKFHEVRFLEGHKSGQTVVTMRAPDGSGLPACAPTSSGIITPQVPALQTMACNADQAAQDAARVCTTPPASQAPEQTGAVLNSETPQDQGPEFERVKPFNCDPAAMLDKGIKPEQLVGMGVNYTGNMASPDGQGAITEVIDTRGERLGSLRLVVLLEDGRRVMGERHYFTEQLRPILQFNGKMHGAPYLAQLAATVATARAQASAAKEEAAQAHAAALVDLVAQYPQLQRADSTYAGGRLAAVNMRTLLKMAFPGQKFSITSSYNSARVCWMDGPTDAEVDAVIGRFDIGASDPHSDYFYTVRTAWSDLFGGVQYLTTSRHTSDDLVSRALCELYPDSANRPAVQDYQKGTGVFDWCHNGDRVRRMMREQLAKMSTYQAPAAKTRARA